MGEKVVEGGSFSLEKKKSGDNELTARGCYPNGRLGFRLENFSTSHNQGSHKWQATVGRGAVTSAACNVQMGKNGLVRFRIT